MEPQEHDGTYEELMFICKNFRANPNINPITGHQMYPGSPEYNEIKNLCEDYEAKKMIIEHVDLGPYLFQTTMKVKILESKYDEILDILEHDEIFYDYIYDNMNAITKYNLGAEYFNNPKQTSVKRNLNSDFDRYEFKNVKIRIFAKFIIELLKIDDFELAQKAISSFKLLNSDYELLDLCTALESELFQNGSVRLWRFYFDLFEDLNIEVYSVTDMLQGKIEELSLKDYMNVIITFFEAAIDSNVEEIIDFMIDYWVGHREDFIIDLSENSNVDTLLFVTVMDELIEKVNNIQ